jgi:TRAP-type C4-dicarboxylate transport system permease small subunit
VIDVQAVDIPKGFVLVVIPLGFFLLCLQFLRRFFEGLKRPPHSEGRDPKVMHTTATQTGKGGA